MLHRDIKPENVLLDYSWNAKLADVGVGRFLGNETSEQGVTHVFTSTLVGTFGYMDPEYLTTGKLGFSSDVYSFGVLMLQMLTGRALLGGSEMSIQDIMEEALQAGSNEFVDASAGEWPLHSASAFGKLGLKCAHYRRKARPALETEVLPLLEQLLVEAQEICNDSAWRPAFASNDVAGCSGAVKASNHISTEDDSDPLCCVVCLDEIPTHAFVPCGHRCVCSADAERVMAESKLCPVCRAPAHQAIRIF